MFLRSKGDEARKAPDAFFPDWDRRWVVGLGILLIIVGGAGIAALLTLDSPFPPSRSSTRFSLVLLGVAVLTFGFGVYCLVKKPTAGSPAGSEKYERLVEKEKRAVSTYQRRRVYALLIALPAMVAVLVFTGSTDPEFSGDPIPLWIAGAFLLASVVTAILIHQQRRAAKNSADPRNE